MAIYSPIISSGLHRLYKFNTYLNTDSHSSLRRQIHLGQEVFVAQGFAKVSLLYERHIGNWFEYPSIVELGMLRRRHH